MKLPGNGGGAEPASSGLDGPPGLDAPAGLDAPPVAPDTAGERSEGMIPVRGRRTGAEILLVRLIASAGVVGIGVAIAAIMTSQHSRGWLIGLIVSIVSMALAAVLWSSRRL